MSECTIYTDCILHRNANGHLECCDCHWIYKGKAENPRRNCPNSPDLNEARERLGISVDDMKHWTQALARWTRAGFPMRTQAEIERIEREHCRPCDQYVVDEKAWLGKLVGWITGTRYGRCKVCGCGVSKSRLAVANKIAMKSEHCKEGKW